MRAKFKCTSTNNYEGGIKGITLCPVTCGSEENKEFFKWTPTGEIKINTLNEAAAAQFEPGKEFYVDFTPVVAPEAEGL